MYSTDKPTPETKSSIEIDLEREKETWRKRKCAEKFLIEF